jgi:hypothetical protein
MSDTKRDFDDVTRPRHYVGQGGIEPFDFIQSNALTFAEGNVIKYILRYREKGGSKDLKKARWYIDKLIAATEQ